MSLHHSNIGLLHASGVGLIVRPSADDQKMYARMTGPVDVTVLQNALDRLVE